MRSVLLVGVVFALGVSITAVQAQSGMDKSLKMLGDSMSWCNSMTWKTHTDQAHCRDLAMNGAFHGTPVEDIFVWRGQQGIILAQQRDAGQITDAQESGQLAILDTSVQNQVGDRIKAEFASHQTSKPDFGLGVMKAFQDYGSRSNPPQTNCTANTYSGTTYTHCQ